MFIAVEKRTGLAYFLTRKPV